MWIRYLVLIRGIVGFSMGGQMRLSDANGAANLISLNQFRDIQWYTIETNIVKLKRLSNPN